MNQLLAWLDTDPGTIVAIAALTAVVVVLAVWWLARKDETW